MKLFSHTFTVIVLFACVEQGLYQAGGGGCVCGAPDPAHAQSTSVAPVPFDGTCYRKSRGKIESWLPALPLCSSA